MKASRSICICMLFLALSATVWAQRDLATVTGTISDPTGAVIPGAKVIITEDATGLAYTVNSDQSGVYVRPALKPSTYTIQVEAPGFKTATQHNVLLTSGDRVGA